jgi:Ser/Thr protein kinase RdoA (MazF antagonist)
MRTDSERIDKERLSDTVNVAYDLKITDLTFIPKGEDALAYVGRTSGGARYFVRVQRAARAAGLARIYAVLYALRHQRGLSQVVAPCPSRQGGVVIPFGDYTVALFPYIEGRTLYELTPSPEDIAGAGALLAELHAVSPEGLSLSRERFENPFEGPILHALDVARAPSPAEAPVQRDLRRLLLAEQADIRTTCAHMQALRAQAETLTIDWVVTHGDPNRDNVLKDRAGRLHLTDWGELALGPAERDLSFWTGDAFETFLRHYASLRPDLVLHRALFEFYFYRWSLQEIADFSTRILFDALGPEEDAHAWEELQNYLPIRHAAIAHGVQAVQEGIDRMR